VGALSRGRERVQQDISFAPLDTSPTVVDKCTTLAPRFDGLEWADDFCQIYVTSTSASTNGLAWPSVSEIPRRNSQ